MLRISAVRRTFPTAFGRVAKQTSKRSRSATLWAIPSLGPGCRGANPRHLPRFSWHRPNGIQTTYARFSSTRSVSQFLLNARTRIYISAERLRMSRKRHWPCWTNWALATRTSVGTHLQRTVGNSHWSSRMDRNVPFCGLMRIPIRAWHSCDWNTRSTMPWLTWFPRKSPACPHA